MKKTSTLEERIKQASLAPMWTRPKMLAKPQSKCSEQLWSYKEIKNLLLEASPHITPEDSERRVLILESKDLPESFFLSPTLFAGVQLLLPGEVAAAHRHSQAAIRFIFEGEGAYASVGGEKVSLEKGDLLINPRNEWHDHGHEGKIPALWLDVLDVPLVDVVDAQFREWSNQAKQEVNFTDGHSNLLFSNGLRATTGELFKSRESTHQEYIRKYSYINSRRTLNELMSSKKLDPYKGAELVYVDPRGGSVLPTIDAFLQGIPAKFSTLSYQSTETKIVVVAEGEVQIVLDDKTYILKKNDIFLIPSWRKYSMTGVTDAVLFSASNKPLLVSTGLWYEVKA